MGVARIARALTGRQLEPEAELVFWLNGLVSMAVGVASWIKLDLSAGAAAGLAAVIFVGLLVSLLNPYAAVIAGALGSLVSGAVGGLIGASLGLRYGGTAGAWAGGALAGSALFVVAASSYRRLVRAGLAARSRRAPHGGTGISGSGG